MFQMQVRVKGKWESVGPTGGEPYEFDTREKACRELNSCYPEQCRIARLDHDHDYEGVSFDGGVRVVEIVQDHVCRRCHDCIGLSHHWMEGFDEDEDGEMVNPDDPRWQCKHCEFSMPYGHGDMDTEEPEDMYEARKREGLIR